MPTSDLLCWGRNQRFNIFFLLWGDVIGQARVKSKCPLKQHLGRVNQKELTGVQDPWEKVGDSSLELPFLHS